MARILVIEDNPANLKLARVILTSAGHEVLQADNATDGLRLAQECAPQLVLMDIQLPGMDGMSATRVLKNEPTTAHIVVIAVTALAMQSDIEKIRAAGCDDYIAKPYRRASLLAAVDHALAADPCSRRSTAR
jgi:two-component system cell cycle response regulator DivK